MTRTTVLVQMRSHKKSRVLFSHA